MDRTGGSNPVSNWNSVLKGFSCGKTEYLLAYFVLIILYILQYFLSLVPENAVPVVCMCFTKNKATLPDMRNFTVCKYMSTRIDTAPVKRGVYVSKLMG